MPGLIVNWSPFLDSKGNSEKYSSEEELKVNKLFVYGILKRGFSLDLTKLRECKFLGEAELEGANLYSINGGVGLRFVDNTNRIVCGEVFEVADNLWRWLDDIENNGYTYTRKIVEVHMMNVRGSEAEELLLAPVKAWVYEHTFPGMSYNHLIEDGIYEKEDY